jgi:hypothetical protein
MIAAINLAPGVPNYRQRTHLDGVEYELVLRWSDREAAWYLDLNRSTGELLVSGIKVVCNLPLLYRFHGIDGVPPGELIATDGRPEPHDPLLDELGDAVPLLYMDASEVVNA